jgi:CRP/FNR family transcriptional regulator, cyclic AMP receptor protein
VEDRLQLEFGSSEIFKELSLSDRERLKALFRPRSFSQNEIIFQKGDPGFGLYLIRGGRVKIYVLDRRGVELVFTFLSRGDLLGELSILDGKPRSTAAVAVKNTDTLYLDRRDFIELLKGSPQACLDIINLLCQRLRRVSTQLEELSFLGVAGRIAGLLLKMTVEGSREGEFPGTALTCSISQEELAKVIGASREMVNKVLNSFLDLGLISISRKKLTLLNTTELNRIASYDGDD